MDSVRKIRVDEVVVEVSCCLKIYEVSDVVKEPQVCRYFFSCCGNMIRPGKRVVDCETEKVRSSFLQEGLVVNTDGERGGCGGDREVMRFG